MSEKNQFIYHKGQELPGVKLLDARMSNFSYSRHNHEEYCFGVTRAGEQHFFSGGEFYRSFPDHVIVFNPDAVHDGQSGGDEDLKYSMLYVHPDQIQPLLCATDMPQANKYRAKETVICDQNLSRRILSLSALIRNGSGRAEEQEAELFEIALILAHKNGVDNEEVEISNADWRMNRIREYIHSTIGDEISLEILASIAGLSKYHFLRVFRRQTGITPWQYIINYRVNQARQALEKGVELADVIFDYGFSDHSHLNRRFKSVYGITPKKWQQTVLANN